MSLRVRDLRWYLERKHVSSMHCKEKSELVDLVLHTNGYRVPLHGSQSNMTTSYRNHRRDSDPISREASESHNSDSLDPDSTWVMVEDELDIGEASGGVNGASGGYTGNTGIGIDERTGDYSSSSSSAGYNHEGNSFQTGNPTTANTTNVKEQIDDANNKAPEEFKVFNIEDITSEEQLQHLTARQLKLILTRNFVDYKGCCEREELMEKVLRLWREKKKINEQNLDDIPDENLCKICMESVIDCVLLECGHMVSCVNCGKRLSECPICRQYVIRAVRIFKS